MSLETNFVQNLIVWTCNSPWLVAGRQGTLTIHVCHGAVADLVNNKFCAKKGCISNLKKKTNEDTHSWEPDRSLGDSFSQILGRPLTGMSPTTSLSICEFLAQAFKHCIRVHVKIRVRNLADHHTEYPNPYQHKREHFDG